MLGLAVLGSAGFAAAGGIELVKSWVITVEVEGPDGPITLDLTPIVESDGDTATISLDTGDIEGIPEGAKVTMTATGSSDGGTITTITDADGNVVQTTESDVD